MTVAKEEGARIKQIMADRALIMKYGGPTALSRQLKLQGPNAGSRVRKWMERGIPPSIKLAYPEVFLPKMLKPGRQK